jgi:L-lactate utilization protein LutC
MTQTSLSNPKYEQLAKPETVQKVTDALKERSVEVMVVNTKEDALAKIKKLIPAKASVQTGTSVTLEQIGFLEYLKSDQHPWDNFKKKVVQEKDPAKQAVLRRQSNLADYFLGSVHAVTEIGQLLIASNTGSQLPSYAFSAPNVIWVVGTHKIVPTLDDAFTRLHEYVYPLENQHMQDLYKVNTALGKILIFERESPFNNRTLRMIFVNEKLGF